MSADSRLAMGIRLTGSRFPIQEAPSLAPARPILTV
jgi:hypothetical protein